MTIIDTLIHTKYLLPVEPMEVLIDHSVAIESGTIVSVLPTYKALKRYTAKETITLNHHILAPGLINMHTHSPMTLMRGLADDLKLMDWLHNHIWPAETAIMSKEYVYDGIVSEATNESLKVAKDITDTLGKSVGSKIITDVSNRNQYTATIEFECVGP